MSKQRVSIGVLATALLVSSPLVAQTESSELVRTPWDAPDLRGVWDFRTITPLERPEEFGERAQLSHDEAAEFEERTLAVRNKDRRASDGLSAQADVANAYNQFWWDYGDKLTDDRRTSLIVDPPDGRIPELTEAAKGRIADRSAARRRPAHGPEDRGVAERCILGFNAGPPMSPSAYNNNVQIFQTEGTVVLLVEMVHDSRIVPLDGRAPLPEDVRQWRGDSRGHWDGDALVVVTTNFTDQTSFRGSGPNMRLTERFTRGGGGSAGLRVHDRGPGVVFPAVDRRRADDEKPVADVRVRVPRRQLRHGQPASRRPRRGCGSGDGRQGGGDLGRLTPTEARQPIP